MARNHLAEQHGEMHIRKKAKYRNVKVYTQSGEQFDSKKEHKRWLELQLLERAGEIIGLTRDKANCTFEFRMNGQLLCKYIADACYYENNKKVVEDTKSPITRKQPVFSIKRKMMLAFYGITIREV